jgi:hypothetical protein
MALPNAVVPDVTDPVAEIVELDVNVPFMTTVELAVRAVDMKTSPPWK